MLYSHNTFGFSQMDTLRFLSNGILPQRFQSIRSLQFCETLSRFKLQSDLENWEAASTILANILGLRQLNLTISSMNTDLVLRVMAFLQRITHVPNFKVIVLTTDPDTVPKLENVPFKIEARITENLSWQHF